VLEEGVLAEGGLSTEAPATVGASEQASRQGESVADGEGRVVRNEREELLPEALLDLPEVGRLARKGGPMHLAEGGEPFAVVAAKEEVDSLVGVDAKELADDLDSEDFGVGVLVGEGPRWRIR